MRCLAGGHDSGARAGTTVGDSLLRFVRLALVVPVMRARDPAPASRHSRSCYYYRSNDNNWRETKATSVTTAGTPIAIQMGFLSAFSFVQTFT